MEISELIRKFQLERSGENNLKAPGRIKISKDTVEEIREKKALILAELKTRESRKAEREAVFEQKKEEESGERGEIQIFGKGRRQVFARKKKNERGQNGGKPKSGGSGQEAAQKVRQQGGKRQPQAKAEKKALARRQVESRQQPPAAQRPQGQQQQKKREGEFGEEVHGELGIRD